MNFVYFMFQVYLFLRACIMRVVPLELLGKKHNFNILLKSKFVRMTIALCRSNQSVVIVVKMGLF